MNLRQYILDKKIYFITQGLTLGLLMILLSILDINRSGRFFVLIFMILGHFSYLVHDYFRRFRFYKEIATHLDALDKKHYIGEFIDVPNFYEGEILESVVTQATKSMNDEILEYKLKWNDYRDYIETWVHEIKTPLAAGHLIADNNLSETVESIKLELHKVEDYVEQALYYARSNHVEKDYVIKNIILEDLIKEEVRRASKLLISKKCELLLSLKDEVVYSDQKWLGFIVRQIMNNCVKYSKSPLKLEFKVVELEEKTILSIIDNGVGIECSELRHVFEKGYVGTNGRQESHSTGIGLYLCNELTKKMGLSIDIDSVLNHGTTVTIAFPKTDYYNRL